MRDRVIRQYSLSFKRQVVDELESGRFASIESARSHYEIGGSTTIPRWLSRFGKNHLRAKVVRVEKPDEMDRIRALKQQVSELQRVLGQTQAARVLGEEFLQLACDELGMELEAFKKKCDGKRCIERTPGED